ncbi:unnamed protein product [Psylliodes chrysocephalus]|uniref:SWIM-type domain-containing protein n=1 Tax=Psylliodes chrysocephalus TaxID=3402493 RepID=A0A9P0GI22_9CUCU|nr:unnamed protein product [Psylliodes chrysocephala]
MQIRVPRLDLHYLKQLTGIYPVNLAKSYIQDKLQREETNILQFDELVEDPSISRIRVYSRFRNICKYMLWIYFTIDENVDHQPLELHYYCTCKSEARTLGTCAHVASVLWFLGYARYEQNMRYPSIQLLNEITDAAERMLPENIDHGPELVEI